MKYHLVTLGCQMNRSDSERVTTVLDEMGYTPTDNEDEANILGVLACSVRQKSIDKVYSKIHKWNKQKNKRSLITFISGCVLPNDRTKFLKLFDIVFQMAELPKLPEAIAQYGITTGFSANQLKDNTTVEMELVPQNEPVFNDKGVKLLKPDTIKPFWQLQPKYKSEYEAFVPIQNGCDKFCTYCAVPYTRGREISRPSSEILSEIRSLIDRGYKTITLLGQNVNSYGNDKKGEEISFADLLDKIGKMGLASGKEFWVYFTSPHPRDMQRDVIETIAKYTHLANQIHLPLQSGDDKVLIRMNRNHSVDKFAKIVDDIRELIPQATLFTDIIVGFTGETEEQFQNTIKSFQRFQFNMAYIAIYSPRPGATSYKWDDDVPLDTKKDRLHVLTEEMKMYTRDYNKSLVGTMQRVLISGYDADKHFMAGLTEGKVNIRIEGGNASRIGGFADVLINGFNDLSLKGELLEVVEPASN